MKPDREGFFWARFGSAWMVVEVMRVRVSGDKPVLRFYTHGDPSLWSMDAPSAWGPEVELPEGLS